MNENRLSIFVSPCTICGCSVAIIGADKERNSFPQIPRELTVSFESLPDHQFLDSINDLFKLFPFAKLPLCPTCLSNCLREISIYASLIKDASKRMQTLLQQAPLSVIKFNVEEYIKQNRIKQILVSPKTVMYAFEESKEEAQSQTQKILSKSEIVPFNPSFLKRQTQQNSLLSFTTFQIGFFEQYGTINGCPIGCFSYKPNPIAQTNAGLFLLAHLISHLMQCIIIPDYSIVFMPEPTIITRHGQFVLQIPEKTRHSKAIIEFNKANDILFSLCADIIAIGEAIGYDAIAPIFHIDTLTKKIDLTPYTYQPNNTEQWSLAMKLLLIDLKTEQLRSLRHCLGYFNA